MGIDVRPISGIGIEISETDVIEKFFHSKIKGYDIKGHVDFLIDCDDFDTFEIKYSGSEYDDDYQYYIFVKDLFKYGKENVQKRIDEFISELEIYKFDTNIKIIRDVLWC